MTGEKNNISQGMLVVHRTGGPAMMVRAISGDHAYCDWFADAERRQGTFTLATLEPAAPDQEECEN